MEKRELLTSSQKDGLRFNIRPLGNSLQTEERPGGASRQPIKEYLQTANTSRTGTQSDKVLFTFSVKVDKAWSSRHEF
jgi:hypothetical protein